MEKKFTWNRRGGYEVSSVGDKRFSALFAKMPDGRSLEAHYACDIKAYDPGGSDWRPFKGMPPLNPNINLLEEYINLWRIWAKHNINLMRILYVEASKHDYVLSDCFANTICNQANALSVILNELVEQGKETKSEGNKS